MQIRPISKELQEKAATELNEVPSRIEEDIKHILEWSRQQPYLKMRSDAQWILSFLRASKFSLQRTKEKLEVYYTFRSIDPQFYIGRDPSSSEVQECFKRAVFALLPQERSSPLQPTRLIISTKNCDPDVITLKNGMKTVIMLADIMLWENDGCVINGQELIYDLGDLRYDYLAQATPKFFKSMIFFLQNAYPSRIRGIYFINVPSFALPIVNLYTSFLSKKISGRVHFYSENDIEKFRKEFPLSVLPDEYGGSAGSMSKLSMELAKKFDSYRDWFLEDAQYGTDESKRPGKPRTAEEFFNMEGSFRKLEID